MAKDEEVLDAAAEVAHLNEKRLEEEPTGSWSSREHSPNGAIDPTPPGTAFAFYLQHNIWNPSTKEELNGVR